MCLGIFTLGNEDRVPLHLLVKTLLAIGQYVLLLNGDNDFTPGVLLNTCDYPSVLANDLNVLYQPPDNWDDIIHKCN